MNHILIIAHQPLADAMRQCALHVFPDCGERVHALDVSPQELREETTMRMAAQLRQHGAPTLILTDVVGATPCNVLTEILGQEHASQIAAISGANVPMLLRAVCYAGLPLPDMQQHALDGGIQGIQALTCQTMEHCTGTSA